MKGKLLTTISVLAGLCILATQSLRAADSVTMLLDENGKKQMAIGDIKEETYQYIVITVEKKDLKIPIERDGKPFVVDVSRQLPQETSKGMMLLEARKYEEAFDQFGKAYQSDVLENPWVAPYIRYYAGESAFRNAKYAKIEDADKKAWYGKAEGQYGKLLEKLPQHRFAPDAALGRALALMRADKFDEAQKAFDDVAKSDYPAKMKVEAKVWGGKLLEEAGKYDEAIQALQKIAAEMKGYSADPSLYYLARLAEAYCWQGKKDSVKAEGIFEEVGLLSPDNEMRAEAFNSRGLSLQARGDQREALVSFLRVVVLHPDITHEYQRALYYAILTSVDYYGNDRRAQQLIQTMKARCPNSPWTAKLGPELQKRKVEVGGS